MSTDESEQFLREARAAGQLRHPSIVSVYEVGRDDGRIYIVSDLVDGVTLADWLSAKQPTPREAAELCAKIAEALHHAHEAGIIHRDLKPANIMLDQDGQPHVMDFGLAKREAGEITMTVQGQVLGTPAYMPPEQAKGESHDADRRSDVYSLGVLLFELLTGEHPFRGNQQMLLYQIIHDDPPSPRKLNSNVPRDLETICLKCLEKEPGRRYETASGFADELRRFQTGEPIRARPISQFARTWRWCKRNPAIATLLLLVILCLAIGGGLTTWQWQRAEVSLVDTENARQEAEVEREIANEKKVIAETARRELEAELRISTAFRLSADSKMIRKQFPQRSVLLAAEAVHATLSHGEPVATAVEQNLHDSLYSIGGRALREHSKGVTALTLSQNGRWLVTAHKDKIIRVSDLKTKDPGHTPILLRSHQNRVTALVLSHDGRRLVTGAYDGTARVWDLEAKDPNRTTIILNGHDRCITSMALSQDGKRLVTLTGIPRPIPKGRGYSGGFEGTARLWDLDAKNPGASRIVLKGHRGITEMSMSLDGRRLVTGSNDKTVRVWDLNAADPNASPIVLRHDDIITGLVLSHDGRRLVTATINPDPFAGETVRLWDLESADPRASSVLLKVHETIDQIRSLTLSGDGRFLVTGSTDKTARIWDLESADPNASPVVLKGHEGTVVLASLDQDAKQLVTISTDKNVRLWDLEAADPGASPTLLRGHDDFIDKLAVSQDGKRMVTGAEDGTARIWDLEPANPSTSPIVLSRVYRFALSEKGNRLATIGYFCNFVDIESTIRVWNLSPANSNPSSILLKGHDGAVLQLELSKDGKQLVTGGSDKTARVWDLEAADPNASPIVLKGHDRAISALALSTDGKLLVTGSEDKTARVWNLEAANPAIVLRGHKEIVSRVAVSDSKNRLVTVSGRTARVWDLEVDDPSVSPFVFSHDVEVIDLVLSKEGKWLCTIDEGNSARVWNLNDADANAPTVIKDVRCLALSHDGTRLFTAGGSKVVRVWELEGIKSNKSPNLLEGHKSYIAGLALSPDSKRLVTGSGDETVRIWNLAARSDVTPIVLKHEARIDSLVLSNNGSRLVTCTVDNTLFMWDLESDTPNTTAIRLNGHRHRSRELDFSGDGKWLVSLERATARVWLLELKDLVPVAYQAAGRELTSEEREQYRIRIAPR